MLADWIVYNTLVAAGLAVVVAGLERWTRLTPAARHALWLVVLARLVLPPVLPATLTVPVLPVGKSGKPKAESGILPGGEDRPGRRGALVSDSATLRLSDSATPSRRGARRGALSPETAGRALLHSSTGVSTLPEAPLDRPARSAEDESHRGTASPASRAGNGETRSPSFDDSEPIVASVEPFSIEPITTGEVVQIERRPESKAADADATGAAGLVSSDATGRNSSPFRRPRLDVCLLVIWGVGALAVAVVQGVRIIWLQRLRRRSMPADETFQRAVADAAAALAVRAPPIEIVPSLATPALCAWGRATLLWPERLAPPIAGTGEEGVLLHELAHLRRRDHWVGWMELLAGCGWWWNPVFWYVRNRLRETAELACDAWVVALLPGGRRAYADALLDVAGAGPLLPQPGLVGFGGTSRTFLERRLIMVMRGRSRRQMSALGLATLLVALVAVLPRWHVRANEEPKKETAETPNIAPVPTASPAAEPKPDAVAPRKEIKEILLGKPRIEREEETVIRSAPERGENERTQPVAKPSQPAPAKPDEEGPIFHDAVTPRKKGRGSLRFSRDGIEVEIERSGISGKAVTGAETPRPVAGAPEAAADGVNLTDSDRITRLEQKLDRLLDALMIGAPGQPGQAGTPFAGARAMPLPTGRGAPTYAARDPVHRDEPSKRTDDDWEKAKPRPQEIPPSPDPTVPIAGLKPGLVFRAVGPSEFRAPKLEGMTEDIQAVVITRVTYKMNRARAEEFVRILQGLDDVDAVVKGDSLQVTANGTDQESIYQMIKLMQRKAKLLEAHDRRRDSSHYVPDTPLPHIQQATP